MQEVLGKTHPDTLKIITHMAVVFEVGLKDYVKAGEMYRRALDGYEKSLGKKHESTKRSAMNLALLLETVGSRKQDFGRCLMTIPTSKKMTIGGCIRSKQSKFFEVRTLRIL